MAGSPCGRRAVHGLCAVLGMVGLVLAGTAVPASAAPPPGHGGHGGHGGGTGGGGGGGTGGGTGAPTPSAGNDVSYPQCGTTLPSAPAFGIVGVNGGLANDLNPCLGPSSSYPLYTQSELYWAAAASTGTSSQPKASVYVNTADPGNFYRKTPISDWPKSGTTPTYGTCRATIVTERHRTYTVGENSTACAWVYGYDMATQDVAWLSGAASAIDGQQSSVTVQASASAYPWWLDVETANTWQSGATGIAMNVADLQGMVAALTAATVPVVGVYSTASQWSQVAGTTTSAAGSLYGLPNWIPGATTLTGAKANCTLTSFTGGSVVLTQWTGTVDNDHAC